MISEKANDLVAAYGEACHAFAWFRPHSLRALIDRAERAEAMVERLIEAGNWLNAMHEDGVFVDELNAARTSWKLAVSDWQSMPSHVTNPLDSQGIVTRNGGEG